MENEDKSLQTKGTKEEKISGFWIRLIAFTIDGIILGIVGFLLGFLYKPVLLGIGAFGRVIGFFVVLLYFGLLNSKIGKGQSLGKKLMKIKVINQKGEFISPLRSFARSAILEIPFFLNNWMLPSSFSKPIIVSIIGFIVFVIGGIIIYLFIFNKETRQSLHDLACGTYVVKEESEGEIEPRKIAIIHYIVSGALILSFFIFSFIIAANLSEDSLMSELHSASEGLYEKENILHASIYVEKRRAFHTNQTTTFVRSTVILREEPESRQSEAKSIAKYLIDNISEAKEKDEILIIISYGFDIGIASWWNSENFSFSPSELIGKDIIHVDEDKSGGTKTENVQEITYGMTAEYDRAIQDYTRAIEIESENGEAYYKRGNAYAHKEEYKKAIQDYNKAIALDPKNAEIYIENRKIAEKLQKKVK
jgi:uncharacterized RDD family membrane protein YckC